MEWISAHLEAIIGIVLALLIPGWKAWKAGQLNSFLVQQMEPHLPTKDSKDAVKAQAIAAGVQILLDKVVKKNGLAKNSA